MERDGRLEEFYISLSGYNEEEFPPQYRNMLVVKLRKLLIENIFGNKRSYRKVKIKDILIRIK